MKRARLRPLPEADLLATTRFYRQAGDDELRRRFFDAALAAVKRIERLPGSGSLRLGEL